MINICIDFTRDVVTIEGKGDFSFAMTIEQVEPFIRAILESAYYSGERLCLENKTNEGYLEIDRYQGLNG